MKKIIAVLLTLACTGVYAQPPQPNRCPSVSAIQAVGLANLANIEQEPMKTWFTMNEPNRYDTDTLWTFGIGQIEASSKNEAMEKANNILAHLPRPQGPVYMGWYMCMYGDGDDGFVAHAVTN